MIKLKKIVESPDEFYNNESGRWLNYDDEDAYPFFYYNGEIFLADKSGIIHYDIPNRAEVDRPNSKDGRIWIDSKILSFWKYPSRKEMKDIANKLSDAFYDEFHTC